VALISRIPPPANELVELSGPFPLYAERPGPFDLFNDEWGEPGHDFLPWHFGEYIFVEPDGRIAPKLLTLMQRPLGEPMYAAERPFVSSRVSLGGKGTQPREELVPRVVSRTEIRDQFRE